MTVTRYYERVALLKRNERKEMTNLEKRDLSQNEAFAIYPKIEAAYELGNFQDAINLNASYERLIANAIMWEQKELSK